MRQYVRLHLDEGFWPAVKYWKIEVDKLFDGTVVELTEKSSDVIGDSMPIQSFQMAPMQRHSCKFGIAEDSIESLPGGGSTPLGIGSG